jgi:hypothetical protein
MDPRSTPRRWSLLAQANTSHAGPGHRSRLGITQSRHRAPSGVAARTIHRALSCGASERDGRCCAFAHGSHMVWVVVVVVRLFVQAMSLTEVYC